MVRNEASYHIGGCESVDTRAWESKVSLEIGVKKELLWGENWKFKKQKSPNQLLADNTWLKKNIFGELKLSKI